jgi:flagellar hook assembly protein FlgD
MVNDRKEPGVYEVVWDGRNDSGMQLGSGVYLYRMVAGEYVQVRKMILIK